ncbi:MAG: hypothetical protein KUG78_16610 [Kangiellaceae bacterium]|nr:hypothetical protein [Kangiellaceae bacterium]
MRKKSILIAGVTILLFISSCSEVNQADISNESNQRMNPEKLYQIILSYAQDVEIKGNVIAFEYQNVSLICVWDANADRMRMLSPIANRSELTLNMVDAAMEANYHTVLDARYAVGDGVLYSAFIHPLSPITEQEVQSAIRQVAIAALTFGSSYSSGELVFPGNSAEKAKKGGDQTM